MTMKLKIHAESLNQKQDCEHEKPEQKIEFELRLQQAVDDVILQAVDKTGEKIARGNILAIDSDGFIVLMADVNKDLGFQLDESGCVKLHKQDATADFGKILKKILT